MGPDPDPRGTFPELELEQLPWLLLLHPDGLRRGPELQNFPGDVGCSQLSHGAGRQPRECSRRVWRAAPAAGPRRKENTDVAAHPAERSPAGEAFLSLPAEKSASPSKLFPPARCHGESSWEPWSRSGFTRACGRRHSRSGTRPSRRCFPVFHVRDGIVPRVFRGHIGNVFVGQEGSSGRINGPGSCLPAEFWECKTPQPSQQLLKFPLPRFLLLLSQMLKGFGLPWI